MTTKFKTNHENGKSSACLVPALGEIWAHFPNLRILLTWKNNKRFANVCKASYIPDEELEFQITVNTS
jgi:hypothetical protein